jgi:hypothetical protein
MKNTRKASDIWKAINDKRILSKMGKFEWVRSYEGNKSAIEYIGLKMITTKDDFDEIEIPIDRNGKKNYGWRKINVSRNGITKFARIDHLLTGESSLKTKEEMHEINTKRGVDLSTTRPKGFSTTNDSESKAIDDLDNLIGISNYTQREHLNELRLYDIAYCMKNDDINAEVFVADQIKSSRVNKDGHLNLTGSNSSIIVNEMISILQTGSLTCIGKTRDNQVDVVWFFYGIDAINVLNKFEPKQGFHPIMHLTKKSFNDFTNAMNDQMFRFDVGKSSEECNRLLQQKLEFIKNGTKHSLIFWNEDDSQIPSKEHRIEQHSMNMTRTACNSFDINVEKKHENSYGPVDFIVNKNVRVQDKVASRAFNVRHEGNLPYNPDDIDIFQVSDLKNNLVYAIPMRIIKDDIVNSFFTADQLMKVVVTFGPQWKENHKQFKHDFSTKDGALSYVKACEEAYKIPQLTDQSFYKNMIDANKDKFGSKKQLADRKLNAVNI